MGCRSLFDVSCELYRSDAWLYVRALDTLNKRARRPDKSSLADAVYTSLRSDLPEFRPELSTFGSLLSIHTKQETSAQTYTRYLDEIAKFHGAPDQLSFQKVLSALAAQGDINGVQQVFLRFSQTHGHTTDPAFYTPLLYAYARLGDLAGTERELQRMIALGVEPTTYVWNIVLHAYARSPEPRRALEVLDKMKADGMTLDVYTFTTLMGVFARIGDTDTVLELLEQAQQNHVEGSYELVTGLIQSYCLNDQAEAAEKVAETATSASLRGYPTTMWNYLLRHYAFAGDSKSMLRVQNRMAALDVRADNMTYATFMTALVVFRKTREAVQILRTLNLSQTLDATPFHYAIILHGFAQEGDRDQANVVYQEMVERYPRIGASPRLAMLHLQAGRSPNETERPMFAAQYLEEILHELLLEDRASRQPQPGLRRRSAVEAVPSLYVEYFVDLLIKKGQVKRAEKLAHRFEYLTQTPYLHLNNSTSMSIPFLTTQMTARAANQEWSEVDSIWKQVLERGIANARRSVLRELPAPFGEKDELENTDEFEVRDRNEETLEPPESLPMRAIGLSNAELSTDEHFRFGSMIPETASPASPLDEPGLEILYAQRYLLETPLSRYLNSLAARQSHNLGVELVAKLENVGFALSSKNWNLYIQSLTRSHDPEHWILAFEIFEQKMMNGMPPWSLLESGYWLPPPESETVRSVPVRRQAIEKRDPGRLMATYYTTVHLASVLLKARTLVAEGDGATSIAIWKVAPLTCRYIRRMPYLKDRIQGLLLRGTKPRGSPPRHRRFLAEPDSSGVLGSKSPVDHVPASEVLDLADAAKREGTIKKSSNEATKGRAVQRAELYAGQIPRTPIKREKRRALESQEEFERRIDYKQGRYLRMLQRIGRDVDLPRAVSDKYIGHPAVPTSADPIRKATPSVGSTIYGLRFERLPELAVVNKLARSRARAVSKDLSKRTRRPGYARDRAAKTSEERPLTGALNPSIPSEPVKSSQAGED